LTARARCRRFFKATGELKPAPFRASCGRRAWRADYEFLGRVRHRRSHQAAALAVAPVAPTPFRAGRPGVPDREAGHIELDRRGS
jgi:hypothetical protein